MHTLLTRLHCYSIINSYTSIKFDICDIIDHIARLWITWVISNPTYEVYCEIIHSDVSGGLPICCSRLSHWLLQHSRSFIWGHQGCLAISMHWVCYGLYYSTWMYSYKWLILYTNGILHRCEGCMALEVQGHEAARGLSAMSIHPKCMWFSYMTIILYPMGTATMDTQL